MSATTTEFEKNKAQWVQQMTAKHDLLGEGDKGKPIIPQFSYTNVR